MRSPRLGVALPKTFVLAAAVCAAGREAEAVKPVSGWQPPALLRNAVCTTVTWHGGGDARWSNPENWVGGAVPTACDVARFDEGSRDGLVDPAFGGLVAGIELDKGFSGSLRLARDITIEGELRIAGGTLEQDHHAIAAVALTQTGGLFEGCDAPVWIEAGAVVTGGLLLTPRDLMRVETLAVRAPGVVRLGTHVKLDIAGDGEPLAGDGLLDTTTNRSTSVEYTGHATGDITAAGPARALRELGVVGRQHDVRSRRRMERAGTAVSTEVPLHAAAASGSGITLGAGEDYLTSAVLDQAHGFAYFGTYTSPGVVVKIDLATFTRVGALTLDPGEDGLSSAVIDQTHGFAYFGTSTSPGIVVKVDLEAFTRVGALTLDAGEDYLSSAVIGPASGFAYFGTDTSPGVVVKVDLATFTRVGALTLDTGEDGLWSAVIDQVHNFAYFGTGTSPGTVVKVGLTTLTRAGTLTFNAGEDGLTSAVIDSASGLAYFGTGTSPGTVVEVDLASLTRSGALTLAPGENELASAVLDPAAGFAYFGTATSPGIVVTVTLATFRKLAVTLSAGQNRLWSAVVDPARGSAYFGTDTNPGAILPFALLKAVRPMHRYVPGLTGPSSPPNLVRDTSTCTHQTEGGCLECAITYGGGQLTGTSCFWNVRNIGGDGVIDVTATAGTFSETEHFAVTSGTRYVFHSLVPLQQSQDEDSYSAHLPGRPGVTLRIKFSWLRVTGPPSSSLELVP